MNSSTTALLLGTLVLVAGSAVACGPREVPNPNDATNAPAVDGVAYGEGPPMPETPKPSSNGGVSVNERTAKSHDVYDKEHTDVVLVRAARSVKDNCGASANEDGKATGPWGKLTLQVTLGHNGHARGTVVPAPYADTPAGRCIVQAFANLTFPPWNGQDTQVDWEVELVKPAAGPTTVTGKKGK